MVYNSRGASHGPRSGPPRVKIQKLKISSVLLDLIHIKLTLCDKLGPQRPTSREHYIIENDQMQIESIITCSTYCPKIVIWPI